MSGRYGLRVNTSHKLFTS